MGISDKDFFKADEIRYFKEQGWIQDGVSVGKHKLTSKGAAQAKRLLDSLDVRAKALIKLLYNPKSTELFTGNGALTTFTVGHKPIDTVISVKVGGVVKVETTDWTVNKTTGAFTFVVAPASAANNVEIIYTEDLSLEEEDLKTLM